MQLVISEKPSVAMSIASVIGADERKDGYVEGGDFIGKFPLALDVLGGDNNFRSFQWFFLISIRNQYIILYYGRKHKTLGRVGEISP